MAARLDGETKMKAKVACVTAFGKMGELAGEHAQLVASHLKSDDAELRTAACITLGNMGRAAQGFAELHIIALAYYINFDHICILNLVMSKYNSTTLEGSFSAVSKPNFPRLSKKCF